MRVKDGVLEFLMKECVDERQYKVLLDLRDTRDAIREALKHHDEFPEDCPLNLEEWNARGQKIMDNLRKCVEDK